MVKYISSRGKVFNLLSFDSGKLEKADFHAYAWGKEVVTRQFGEIVNRFTKSAQSFDCTFKFKGSPKSRASKIEAFHFESEYDISHQALGRIVWGDCYIEGYWISFDTYPDGDGQGYTISKGTFYAPYPFWINEYTLEIYPSTEAVESEDSKGYVPDENRYGYSYSYAGASNTVRFNTEHYKDSDFKVIAYGPATEVSFNINGNLYEVDYPLRANQYMVIDSRQSTEANKQCYVVNETGVNINVFDYRNPDGDIFKKIPSGACTLVYPRTYGLQFTIYKERSEPI